MSCTGIERRGQFFKIIHVHQTAAVAMGSDRDHQTCLQTEKRMSGKSVLEGKGKTERLSDTQPYTNQIRHQRDRLSDNLCAYLCISSVTPLNTLLSTVWVPVIGLAGPTVCLDSNDR